MDLEDLFETLDRQAMEDFVHEKEQENLHLEFKTVGSASMKREDRENFAKALSGFSNANGGLVVWGIDAPRNDAQVNCAKDSKPIDGVSRFLSKLESLTGQFVDPQVRGVRHRVVYVDEKADKGFAVSLIPESETGPHMSALDSRYWVRSGDSFYRMTHSQVSDRFFRKRKPRLGLYTELSRVELMRVHGEEYVSFELIIGLANEGTGLAKYPYLSLLIHVPYVVSSGGLDGWNHEGLPRIPKGRQRAPVTWGAGADIVIHPGAILEITKLKPPVDRSRYVGKDIVLEYEIRAEDMQTVRDKKVIRYSDILDKTPHVK